MPATTATLATEIILANLRTVTGYGQMLVNDIPAERFAHMPHPDMNSPAFCIGHLSLYPDRALEFIGKGHLAKPREDWSELFRAGVQCVDDGTYPSKDELVARFTERHEAIAEALPGTPDSVLTDENPADGRFKQMNPTIGAAVSFLLVAHPMVHMGQISAWRRAIGLGGVL